MHFFSGGDSEVGDVEKGGGAGGGQEAGVEGAGGGINRRKLRAQCYATEKAQRQEPTNIGQKPGLKFGAIAEYPTTHM